MQKYIDSNIKVLQGLDPVKKRPGMYIGSTDVHGLHHLIWEIFDNSVDEVISGNADRIKITLKKDQSVIVEDNGRGIPIGVNPQTKLSTIDTVFTVLHAGGKFDENAYKTSGGLHGVGSSVVNALSDWMIVTVKRENKICQSKFINGGDIEQKNTVIGNTNRTGTTVHFKPNYKIFRNARFNSSTIKERIRESTYLYSNLTIVFENEFDNTTEEFFSKNGISEYVAFINEGSETISNIGHFQGKGSDNIEIDVAFQYTSSTNCNIVSFANSVKTKEGGSHEQGFKTAITECLNDYARQFKLLKEKDKNFEGDDVREGLTVVLSVRVPEKIIQYEGQTKNKLFTQEAFGAVKKFFSTSFSYWLEENKNDAKKIIEKTLLARDARLAAKKAREETKKIKSANKQTLLLSGKLTPAQSKDYSKNELFLVEGDSAGGTAKLARDKRYQAILPLRGKILNVEKSRIVDLLKNEEISTIISCLGAGVGNDFNIENARYAKVIIMTDADTDGAHIQVLLLTFFYRFMRPLIENGSVYVAMPPLHKITSKDKKQSSYAWNEDELNDLKQSYKSFDIQRYKGLGEMSSEQLKQTTMDLNTRQLIKVNINDAILAERRVNVLMGSDPSLRKKWIDEHVDFSLEENN